MSDERKTHHSNTDRHLSWLLFKPFLSNLLLFQHELLVVICFLATPHCVLSVPRDFVLTCGLVCRLLFGL